MTVEMQRGTNYEQGLLAWRQVKEGELRGDDGWLTVVGLGWLREGSNTVGSALDSDIVLPESAPEHLGIVQLDSGVAQFTPLIDHGVEVDGHFQAQAVLRSDSDPLGATMVTSGAVMFWVIRRGDQLGIRVRDRNSSARQQFTGRRWYAADPSYNLLADYTPYTQPQTIQIANIVGMVTPMQNIGYVTFQLREASLHLEAVQSSSGLLWFILKDSTSGKTTYGGGRFLMADRPTDNRVVLDFNKAYHPPCAFTAYATCPIPPKENHLPIAIEAGERL